MRKHITHIGEALNDKTLATFEHRIHQGRLQIVNRGGRGAPMPLKPVCNPLNVCRHDLVALEELHYFDVKVAACDDTDLTS